MENKLTFTFDEWIYHYLKDKDKSQIVLQFLVCLLDICDKFSFQFGTPLAHKIFEIFEFSSKCEPKQRNAINFFMKSIFKNSNKRIDIQEIKHIPEEFLSKLHRKDHYLLDIVYSTKSKILITTDERLRNQINENATELGIMCYLADEFMTEYVNKHCKNKKSA
jgi:predicted nucleic acid-binding protein